jgi:hypothetical protein
LSADTFSWKYTIGQANLNTGLGCGGGRWRKPKGIITNVQKFRWRQKEHVGCNKKLDPFWALVFALKYLAYLLDKATRSRRAYCIGEDVVISVSPTVSLFHTIPRKAGKAVEHYLVRFDGKEQREGEVSVGPPLLSNV